MFQKSNYLDNQAYFVCQAKNPLFKSLSILKRLFFTRSKNSVVLLTFQVDICWRTIRKTVNDEIEDNKRPTYLHDNILSRVPSEAQ